MSEHENDAPQGGDSYTGGGTTEAGTDYVGADPNDAEAPEGFTKEDAEKAGWVFVHAQEPRTVTTSETQGESRYIEGSYRAEKTVGGSLINEFGETEELLLQRIEAYERHLGNLPEGHTDTIYDGEKQHFLTSSPIPGAEAAQELARDLEDARTAQEPVATKQVDYDTADTIDSPGQSAGGTVVVQEGDESLADASKRIDAQTAQEENDRVLSAQQAAETSKYVESGGEEGSPEGLPIEAVVDVSDVEPNGDVEQAESGQQDESVKPTSAEQ